MKNFGRIIFWALFVTCSTSWGCLDSLKNFKQSFYFTDRNGEPGDLCALSDRYRAAKDKLRELNIDAQRVADVRAPRFIKLSTWESTKSLLYFGVRDPRFIYDRPGQPRGSVWGGWDQVAKVVDERAQSLANQGLQGRAVPFTEFSLSWFQTLHGQALGQAEASIAGRYRSGDVHGSAYYRRSAISSYEVQAIQHSGYPSLLNRDQNIVTWTRTVCFEDLPSESREAIRELNREGRGRLPKELLTPLDAYDLSVANQCGYYTYAPSSEIQPQLEALEAEVIKLVRTHLAGQSSHHEFDPLFIAARAQRWYVSIHPFNGGNGRTSRFIMDYILQRVGLPAPVLDNMDLDITTTEAHWARLVGQGMLNTVERLEACIQTPASASCQEIPR